MGEQEKTEACSGKCVLSALPINAERQYVLLRPIAEYTSDTDGADEPTNQSADSTDDGSDRPTDKQPKSAKQRIGTPNDTKSACGSSNKFTSHAWIHGIQPTVSADTVLCAVSGAISAVLLWRVLRELCWIGYFEERWWGWPQG